MALPRPLFSGFLLIVLLTRIGGQSIRNFGCSPQNYCNGHGKCVAANQRSPKSYCECDQGWGGPLDPVQPDPTCASRVCPVGKANAALPSAPTKGHDLVECSNIGVCDRSSGECACPEGREGRACEMNVCPNQCSGHGRCIKMVHLALKGDATPLTNSSASYYSSSPGGETWDQDFGFGCICDSDWPVGLDAGEYQQSTYTGADCSLRRCPSGNDPTTYWDDENCEGVTAPGGLGVGLAGNKCLVQCSNRGACDEEIGACECFKGYYGSNCNISEIFVGFEGVE